MSGRLRDFEPSSEFTTTLDLLERRGAAMLLVGTVDDRAIKTVVRRMLGGPMEDRYRILALLNDNDPSSYLPQPVTPDHEDVEVLQYPRGRGAADVEMGGNQPDGASQSEPLLEELHRSLQTAAEELARSAPDDGPDTHHGFKPGELRVAIDSLQPLIETAGIDRVIEWLISDPIPFIRDPGFRGRSHWVYYGRLGDPAIDELMAAPDLFDVLVRIRRRQRFVEYQWVVPSDRFPHLESRIVTPWLSVEE